MLYPLKFKPLVKERIWGSRKLETLFAKRLPRAVSVGESWEISSVQGDVSVVANGALKGNSLEELIEIYMGELVGDSVFGKFGVEFPLLVKLIDAAENLSIQVHPDDKLAAERHQAFGKTEIWYVMDHEPQACVYLGFKKQVTREQYLEHLGQGRLEELLNKYTVSKGDMFFIPSGTIHAIGGGVVVAEIQQASDVTYRIYDFDRVDNQGVARELHTDLAVDAIDYGEVRDYVLTRAAQDNRAVGIESCPYFASSLTRVVGSVERDYSLTDSFVVYICVEGSLRIECDNGTSETLKCGETVLIPAIIDSVTLTGDGTIIESYVP